MVGKNIKTRVFLYGILTLAVCFPRTGYAFSLTGLIARHQERMQERYAYFSDRVCLAVSNVLPFGGYAGEWCSGSVLANAQKNTPAAEVSSNGSSDTAVNGRSKKTSVVLTEYGFEEVAPVSKEGKRFDLWIELYNEGVHAVDITDWSVEGDVALTSIKGHAEISAGRSLVLSSTTTIEGLSHAASSTVLLLPDMSAIAADFAKNGRLTVIDADGTDIDELDLSKIIHGKTHGAFPTHATRLIGVDTVVRWTATSTQSPGF